MTKNHLKSFTLIRNERGSLLTVSYLVIFVVATLGVAFMVMSSTEKNVAERQKRTVVALALAEAGIERALYDLRLDFVAAQGPPSWGDCNINGIVIPNGCPNTNTYYTLPYTGTSLNDGVYLVQLKNVVGQNDHIWIESTGTIGSETEKIRVYAKMTNASPWANAIFAGAGAAGAMVNGNVNIRGSVHILGAGLNPTNHVIMMGGTAELVGNNYTGLDSALAAKVPALPTVVFNNQTVKTLNAKLRVKRGIVGIDGDSKVGEPNNAANDLKETVDGSFVTNGFDGNQGTNHVYSDNGWSNPYDLGDSVTFPSLSDPYQGTTYQLWFRSQALVISNAADLAKLAAITPNSNFDFYSGSNRLKMDGSTHQLTVSGKVYIEGGQLNMNKSGNDRTITYSGMGLILVTGDTNPNTIDTNINVNLVTSGNNSFPSNILAVMTPKAIKFDEANIDVMGLFYAEEKIKCEKQTDVMGTFVSNYFDMGNNVPSIFQVPDTVNHLPPGLIGQSSAWALIVVSWQKI